MLLVISFARSPCRELAQRYNQSYTANMKTAISLPNDVFEAAEATAKHLGLSRSELYTRAIRAYLEAHGTDRLTERLNEVYGEDAPGPDPLLSNMQLLSLPKEEW